jgi:hypothetical protein
LKLRERDTFEYKGWRIDKMEAELQPNFWVACKNWTHDALGCFRSVTISSFDSPHKVRDYVKIMNTVLKGFELELKPNETSMDKH